MFRYANLHPIILLVPLVASLAAAEPPPRWPHWRGPGLDGVAVAAEPPTTWSETENVKWKIRVPGKGHATPIVWNDRIFVLAAVPTEQRGPANKEAPDPTEARRGPPSLGTDRVHKFTVFAYRRADGQLLWEKTVREEVPAERTHGDGSWASNSPVTDGERIYAFFGSRGLHCLDFDGKLLWQKDLGRMAIKMQFGEGSSPLLCGDAVIVNWDHEGKSFIIAYNRKTGDQIWKVDRDEATSWSSPVAITVGDQTQIIVSATKRIRSYDPATGEELWNCGGMTGNVIPMPVWSGDIIYLASGFRGNALLAIKLSQAKGDISDTQAIAWKYNQNTPYTPSPVLLDGRFYMLKQNSGQLTCLNAADGSEIYVNQKLEGLGTVYASPMAAAGQLYIASKNGKVTVVKAGPKFEVVATNVLKDDFTASPVAVGKHLYLRGLENLYCLGPKD